MKYSFLIVLALIVQNCTINKNLDIQEKPKQGLVSHELITGQWVETNDLNRLKARDISDPHPFQMLVADHLTCFKEGRPYYEDLGNNSVFLEEKDDYYGYMDEYVTLKLHFNVSENDTTMTLESQFQANDPYIYLLSKVPIAKSCDFQYSPGASLRSGINESYRYYYFKGKYTVKDIDNEKELIVEISSDGKIFGLTDFDKHNFSTFGSQILLQLFKAQENYRYGLREFQNLVLVAQEYGFDLHKTNYSNSVLMSEKRYEILDKVYEFRRKN